MNSTEPCTYRVSVKGIAIDESGRFLLTKEDIGRWEMGVESTRVMLPILSTR
jgi:hypothetical protein